MKKFFADKYHLLKLTQKLSAGNTRYHSVNVVVPTKDIASALDNLTLATTMDNIHMDQMMPTTLEMIEINRILGYQIKHMANTNAIMKRQVHDEKNHQTKMKITLQNWPQASIVLLMD